MRPYYNLALLNRRQLLRLSQTIHDILWPPDDPLHDWSPGTLEEIADAFALFAGSREGGHR